MGNTNSQERQEQDPPVTEEEIEEPTPRHRVYPKTYSFDFPQFPDTLPLKLTGVLSSSQYASIIERINDILHVDTKQGCFLTSAGLCLCLGGCFYCAGYIHCVREKLKVEIRKINKEVEESGLTINYFSVSAGEDEGFKANHFLEIEISKAAMRKSAFVRSSARTSLSLNEGSFVTKPQEEEKKKKKSTDLSASDLFESDPQLKKVDRNWGRLATDESIEKTVKALTANKVKVDVVGTKEAALDVLKAINVKDSSIYVCGSTSLEEVGWLKFLKENKSHAKRNIKAESVAAGNRGDRDIANELMREGMRADFVFTSVPAISEKGDLTICCMTGTRTGAFAQTAKTLVVVAGTNKIVDSYETCLKRMQEYALPLESARVRVAFKNLGVSASAINFSGAIRGTNPYDPSVRLHVILVKQHLGF